MAPPLVRGLRRRPADAGPLTRCCTLTKPSPSWTAQASVPASPSMFCRQSTPTCWERCCGNCESPWPTRTSRASASDGRKRRPAWRSGALVWSAQGCSLALCASSNKASTPMPPRRGRRTFRVRPHLYPRRGRSAANAGLSWSRCMRARKNSVLPGVGRRGRQPGLNPLGPWQWPQTAEALAEEQLALAVAADEALASDPWLFGRAGRPRHCWAAALSPLPGGRQAPATSATGRGWRR